MQRIEEGWQFLALGSELRFMLNGVNEAMQKLSGERSKRDMAKY